MVAGSYPPIPVPAADSTVDAVRRALDEGHEVTVVAPRPSAAHYAVPLVGVLAGRRLGRLRRMTGTERLVFVVETSVPFDPPGHSGRLFRVRASATAHLLARAFGQFEHSTLILAGDTFAPDDAMRILESAADEVIEDRRSGQAPPGVTTRGPVELRARDRARRLVGGILRRLGLRG
jgi:hypothetical protein